MATQSDNTDTKLEPVCPNCGMFQSEWTGNNGKGVQVGNETYCCQGCAMDTGCTCK